MGGAMGIRLNSVEIKNFRSIFGEGEATQKGGGAISLDLGAGINAIIGPNNAGKSNVLRAIAVAFGRQVDTEQDWPQLAAPRAQMGITLGFVVDDRPTASETTLLRYAQEYEVDAGRGEIQTNASANLVRLRVKFASKNTEGTRFIAVAGYGDRRGDEEKNVKTLKKLEECVRFVYVRSGEDVRDFLAGRFNEILRSVLKEASAEEFNQAREARETYIRSLQGELLKPLCELLKIRLQSSFPDINGIEVCPRVPTLEESLAAAGIRLTDDAETDLDAKGTGIRGGLLVSMLRYLSTNSRKSLVFLVEEPESFLHPAAQKHLLGELEDLVDRSDTTVIMTSHSPFMMPRREVSKVFALAKNEQGATVRKLSPYRQDARQDLAVLFDDPFLPRLFSDLLDLPENKDRVLVLEGTTDEAYFLEAARHHNMEERLRPVYIIPAEGAEKAAIVALAWRGRGVPTAVVLDHDEPGRKAQDLLKKSDFGGKLLFSYNKYQREGLDHDIEAEDLLSEQFLRSFRDAFWNEEEKHSHVIEKESRGPLGDKPWRCWLNVRGKDEVGEYLKKHGQRADVAAFAQLLDNVLTKLAKAAE